MTFSAWASISALRSSRVLLGGRFIGNSIHQGYRIIAQPAPKLNYTQRHALI